MSDLIIFIVFYIRIGILAFFFGLIFNIIYRFTYPYYFRMKYRRYANVYVDPEYKFMMGDLYYYLENQKNNKVFYSNAKENAEKLNKYDMKVSIEGIYTGIKLISGNAIREFLELQPEKIDRQPETRGIGQVIPR